MEEFLMFVLFISIVWSIVCMFLFVKVWKMTTYVKDLHDSLLRESFGNSLFNGIHYGNTVVRKSDGRPYVVNDFKMDDSEVCLKVEGIEEWCRQSEFLSLEKAEQLRASLIVGEEVNWRTSYYVKTGTLLSIDEEGMCKILLPREKNQEKECPYTRLTPKK